MRIAGSFAIVTVVYWLYTLLAVPWIEPPADPQRGEFGVIPHGPGDPLIDRQIKQLQPLFPPDAWEGLKKSIIINLGDDRAKLLFQEYHNYDDGRVEIQPCTVVIAPSNDENDDERRRQSVILEAPDGAVLRFDPPLDVGQRKIGRLVEGQLRGAVTIRSDGKSPGPEDDLRIVTSDVQLTDKTVTTPNVVSFRWGPHLGQGARNVHEAARRRCRRRQASGRAEHHRRRIVGNAAHRSVVPRPRPRHGPAGAGGGQHARRDSLPRPIPFRCPQTGRHVLQSG